MSRIELEDTGMDVLVKMSDGNPGALTAMAEILKHSEHIDPQNVFGGLGTVLFLDTCKIYGSNIHILYKDICGCSVRKLILLTRAVQLGFFPMDRLQQLASGQNLTERLSDVEWQDIDTQVCERLESFQKAEV